MKILAISDRVDPDLRGPGLEVRASGVDVILSCGDLPFAYLEYLVTFLGVPLFYVRGNHDPPEDSGKSPRGCIPLDGRIQEFGGFSLVGLSGCRWYSGGPNQYTERQMRTRGMLASLRLAIGGLLGRRRSTIFVSHAAPRGVGDADDICHKGFDTFSGLIRRHDPTLWLHGHVHLYDRVGRASSEQRSGGGDELEISSTRVVNAYGYRVITV